MRGIRAQLGRDGATVELHLGAGQEVAILPARPEIQGRLRLVRAGAHLQSLAQARAAVLEPFGDELHPGMQAGQAEADDLTRAGFAVDVRRDEQVNLDLMSHLPDYAVVYLETHAGTLANGDAVVATRQTDMSDDNALLKDGSVVPVTVAGDAAHDLYAGITGKFITGHTGRFQPHSLLFLNGCSALAAPRFWSALSSQGLSTLISWNADVYDTTETEAGAIVMDRLAGGDTASQAIQAAYDGGVGMSVGTAGISRLGLLGDGADALTFFATPLPTSTPAPPSIPTATATPRPTARPARKPAKRCARGKHRVHGKCRPKKPHRK